MKIATALLKGAAVWGGLAFVQTAWGQGAMAPAPASAGQAKAGQASQGQGGTARAGRGVTTSGTAAVTSSALPAGTAPEKIAQITILGNRNIGTEAVRAALTEKVGDVFDAQAAERDRQAVSALGYWATPAQIADLSDPKGGVDLTFSVVENPVIQGIRFNANTLSGEPTIPAPTMLALMQTKPGQVLNTNALQSDLDALFRPGTGYAARQGYLFTAGSSLTIDPATGVLTVPVIEAYVQAVRVVGNGRTPDTDILPSLPVKAGDLYNAQAIQSRLASFPGTKKFRVAGPASVEPTAPGRVALTIPVAGRT